MIRYGTCVLLLAFVASARAQTPPKPFRAEAVTSIVYSGAKDEEMVEITNVAWQITGDDVPGGPKATRLVLRQTTRSKEVLGDEGAEAHVTLEAWPLGAEIRQKPLYSTTVEGSEAYTLDNGLWVVVDRATDPDLPLWRVYHLGTGAPFFDSYVEPLRFSVSRANGDPRYAGLEVPPDDTPDTRLRDRHVVAVLVYASPERLIREALITCDDPQRAGNLRSYWDEIRTLSVVDQPRGGHAIRIVFAAAYPSPPAELALLIPIAKDDLDFAHTVLPGGLHVTPWNR
jgi:hypothetical protein